jgi:methylmalonyl-CoA mutase N-terminal domain/subunit
VVGVNRYTSEEKVRGVPIHRIDPAAESSQIARLRHARNTRDGAAVTAALSLLESEARNQANVMPAIVEAVRRDASVGEISDTLRGVFGEFREALTV